MLEMGAQATLVSPSCPSPASPFPNDPPGAPHDTPRVCAISREHQRGQSRQRRHPGRAGLRGTTSPVGSGGMPQSTGAVSGGGTGGSARPVRSLSVTQHRTTPCESPQRFLVHPEFSLPGPSWQHRPSPAPCR